MKLKLCLELSIKPKVLLIKRVHGITSLTALHNHHNNIKNNNNDNNNYYYCNDNVNYGNFPTLGDFLLPKGHVFQKKRGLLEREIYQPCRTY